jgi:hypothetical protein
MIWALGYERVALRDERLLVRDCHSGSQRKTALLLTTKPPNTLTPQSSLAKYIRYLFPDTCSPVSDSPIIV